MANLCFIAIAALVLVAFLHSYVSPLPAQEILLPDEDHEIHHEIHHELRVKRQIGWLGVGAIATAFAALWPKAPPESTVIEKNPSKPGDFNPIQETPQTEKPVEEPVFNTNQIAYMGAHLVHNSNEDYDFCPVLARRGPPDFMDAFPLASLAYLIYIWGEKANDANNADVYFEENVPEPFTEVVMRRVTNSRGEQMDIPVYMRASIRRSNLPAPRSRKAIPASVYKKMGNMGNIKGKDDAGHGLAYSLGGGMLNEYNYFPQANRLNRHVGGRSLWLKEERDMSKFLMDNPTGRIEWDMFVIYDDPLGDSYRPAAFCLQHTDYDDDNQAHEGPELCFGNDPEDDCRYDQREPNNNGVPTPPPPGIA